MTDVFKQGDTVMVRDYDDDGWTGYGGTHVLLCTASPIFNDHAYIVLNTTNNEIDKWAYIISYDEVLEERLDLLKQIERFSKKAAQNIGQGRLYGEIDIEKLRRIESLMAYL